MKFHLKIITSTTIAITLSFCSNAFAQNMNGFSRLSFSGSAQDLVLKTGESFILDLSLTTPRTPFSTSTNSGNAVLGNSSQSALTITFDQFGRAIDSVAESRFISDVDKSSVVATLDVTPSSENNLQSTDIILNKDNNTGLNNIDILGLAPTLSATGDVIRSAPNNSNDLNIGTTLPTLSKEIPIEFTLPSIIAISAFK